MTYDTADRGFVHSLIPLIMMKSSSPAIPNKTAAPIIHPAQTHRPPNAASRMETRNSPIFQMMPKIPSDAAMWMLALTGALPRERYDPEDVIGRFATWAAANVPRLNVPGLEAFARDRGFVRRGEELDTHNAAGAYLRAFNEGKLGRLSFEEPPLEPPA